MIKFNIYAILCVAFICVWVGMTIYAVGSVPPPETCSKPYDVALPFEMLFVTAVPAAFGYLWGNEESNKSGTKKANDGRNNDQDYD